MSTGEFTAPFISWSQIVDRQTGLITPAQNEVIRNTRLLMLGVGGMGMNAAANLVRAGFENFTLVDFDAVDGTAANRTPFAFDDTLGLQKTDATRRYMLKVNPRARIEVHSGVKLALDSDPAYMRELVERHDVLSWAMDGIAGRIYYTRLAHEVGSSLPAGKPAVESWAIPYHLCVWTHPNTPGSPTWEECFQLPTVGRPIGRISEAEVRAAQKVFFRRLGEPPRVLEDLDPGLMDRWFGLRIPNRTLGHMVVGCGALIAHEVLVSALELGGEPLAGCVPHRAPWMGLCDVRGHAAYEYNYRRRLIRWRHPVTGRVTVEPWNVERFAGTEGAGR